MRIEDGDVSLKTRAGLDWTDKFPVIAKAAAKLPNAIIDGEIVALGKTASLIFRRCRLRCRRALPKILFSSLLIFCSSMRGFASTAANTA